MVSRKAGDRRLATLLVVVCCFSCTAGRIERAIRTADELRGTGQYESALQSYELIVLKYPGHPKVADVLLRIGDLYHYTLHDGDRARAAYERVTTDWLTTAPAIQAFCRLAELHLAREDYPGAIESYERLLKYYPAYAEWDVVRHAIGAAYIKEKQYVQARIELYRLLEREGVTPAVQAQTLFDIAETFLLEGKPEAAVPYYQRLIAAFPTHELAKPARLQLLQAYLEARDFAAAVGVAQELRRHYPGDPAVQARVKQFEAERATVGRPGQLPWK